MWYNSSCHVEQNTRALCFLNAAQLSQFDIVGKVPSINGNGFVLAVPRDNGSAICGGHFAMSRLVDLTDQKFGKLTVIKRYGSSDTGHITWLCRCDCGNEAIVRGVDLTRGHTIGCHCQMKNLIDETGNRYGKLTVIERALNEKNSNVMWRCLCDCGRETIVGSSSLRSGGTKSCGCQHPLPKGEASFNALINNFKTRARVANLEYSLTSEQVYKLTQSTCYYCGVKPYQVINKNAKTNGEFVYNGLDRVDNSKGYTIDNVVTCCGVCNRAKSTLSISEFKDLICRIYKNWASEGCDQ